MNEVNLKGVIEALLFSSSSPLTLRKMAEILEVPRKEIKAPLLELMEDYQENGRGVIIREVAGGYKVFTRPEFASFISKLKKNKKRRLSRPALETLAIIAYRQPVTHGEIQEIRGVEVRAILHNLLQRKLIRVVGKKNGVGHPLLYGTTEEFLHYFGLKSLEELPRVEELCMEAE
ncbi:MAG: SMC-Scp complex subunit ScpB [Caldiserica bacterium]|nr:SMC-Scp complex subunit ScpB [Caldisericota bacterium]